MNEVKEEGQSISPQMSEADYQLWMQQYLTWYSNVMSASSSSSSSATTSTETIPTTTTTVEKKGVAATATPATTTAGEKKFKMGAAGEKWEDQSLAEWPEDDFRIFVGDIGNDCTDELLRQTFNRYPSFQKAK